MRKNSLLLDKFSIPSNHVIFISMQIMKTFRKREIHLSELVNKVLMSRNGVENIEDESRVLKAMGFLILQGKIEYCRGMISKVDK